MFPHKSAAKLLQKNGMYKKTTRKSDYACIKSPYRGVLLSFAQFSERNFGGIAIGKAASEVTFHF